MSTIRCSSIRASVRLLTTGLAAFAVVAAASRAHAATAFALSTSNQIVTFDTSTPASLTSVVAITGLQPAEDALAIDLRPATGQSTCSGARAASTW